MIDNVNHLLYLEIIKMGSGRALQKSLFIRNGRGYKAKLVLGFFNHIIKNNQKIKTIKTK